MVRTKGLTIQIWGEIGKRLDKISLYSRRTRTRGVSLSQYARVMMIYVSLILIIV